VDLKLVEALALLLAGGVAGGLLAWFIASKKASREIAASKAQAEAQLANSAEGRQQALQQIGELKGRYAEARTEITALRAEGVRRDAHLDALSIAVSGAQSRLIEELGQHRLGREAADGELRKCEERLAEAEAELQNVRMQLAQAARTLAEAQDEETSRPVALTIGEDASHPAIRIAPLEDTELFQRATPISDLGIGLGARSNAVLQALPQLLVANAHHGHRLMEVVIQGDLVRAASGESLRAWAAGANGRISEHARLFDTGKLQTIVTAAALWSVASVIVAQKHLADISRNLKEIDRRIEEVKGFLDAERRGRITGTYSYLKQASDAILQGDWPDAIRDHLEACERDMQSVEKHLIEEFQVLAGRATEHPDSFGTKEFREAITQKLRRLKELGHELDLCLRTRIFGWFVLCLHPGAGALKETRKRAIAESIARIYQLRDLVKGRVDNDLERFRSPFNTESILRERKEEVQTTAERTSGELVLLCAAASTDLDTLSRRLEDHAVMRVVLEVDGDRIIGTHMLAGS